MSRKKRILIGLLAGCLLLCGCANSTGASDQTVQHEVYTEGDIDFSAQAQNYLEYIGTYLSDRSGAFSQHDDARDWIIDELINAGYSNDQITLQDIQGKSGQNIILKVAGTDTSTDDFIVIGAHYDGDGVGDNGSGIALLLSSAIGLQQHELPLTTYFVFFDEEESGCFGSSTFVYDLSDEQLQSMRYMINIDAIAFGDYCNIYGGVQDPETMEITQTEIYDYACSLAGDLGFNVYDTAYLDGYYAEHGEGPELDPRGVFTNPWTLANPAPEDTVEDYLHAYSPTTIPASDHVDFEYAGIPYVYFEATNWYVADPDWPDQSYIGYSDVGDLSLGENGCIMNTEYDNLDYLNEHFPGRSLEHFELYSPLLSRLILEPYDEI